MLRESCSTCDSWSIPSLIRNWIYRTLNGWTMSSTSSFLCLSTQLSFIPPPWLPHSFPPSLSASVCSDNSLNLIFLTTLSLYLTVLLIRLCYFATLNVYTNACMYYSCTFICLHINMHYACTYACMHVCAPCLKKKSAQTACVRTSSYFHQF